MTRSKKQTAPPRPFQIGVAEEKLLHAVARYSYLTAAQATRLLFSQGSRTYVMEKLRQLAINGYLLRLYLPRRSQHGRELSVYTLDRNGRRFLTALGVPLDTRFRPSEEQEKSLFFLRHTLAVNDVLIAAELLCQAVPQIVLKMLLHERVLKRRPVYVQVPTLDSNGRPQTVRTGIIPDGIVEFHVQGTWQEFLLFEVDRGTIEEKRWKHKIRAYLAYSHGVHERIYGTPALTIAVVATPGEKRQHMLRCWTEETLAQLGVPEEGERFLFTDIAIADVSPVATFLTPVWYQAFLPQPQPLLRLEEGGP